MFQNRRSGLRWTAVVAAIGLLVALGLHAPTARADVTATKTCTGPEGGSTATVGEFVTCLLVISGSTGTPPDIPAGSAITISALDGNYTFVGAECDALGTENAGCDITSVSTSTISGTCTGDATAACEEVTVTETIEITSLRRERISQRVVVGANPPLTVTDPIFRVVAPGTTVFVSTRGDDANNCRTRARACATLNRALVVADNGDSVLLEGGTYDIQETVFVDKLVTIEPDGSGVKVILDARPGVTIFRVRAPGGQNRHVIIRNMTMGGNYRDGATDPVIALSGDSYTEITGNIIGGIDLPINNGIVIANSLRPNIRDNTFIGNTQTAPPFEVAGVLVVGRTVTGFGIVSLECLGLVGLSVSTELQLVNNSFTGLWTSGIWICADGGGAHLIDANVFRNYWRGIALKDITDTKLTNNTLVGGRSDGLVIYGASVNVTVENNRIESNVGADAAALRVGWIADPLVPRANRIVGNRISRATLAIHVFGAQTTMILNNTINVTGTRTGILLTTAARPLDPGTQPINTEVVGNQVISDGPCAAQFGCALRLFGVTVPVLAINNDWGLRTVPQVEEVIWHQPDDPLLGLVTFVPFTSMVTLPSPSPPSNGNGASPSPTPTGGGGPPPSPTPTATPTNGSTSSAAASASGTRPAPAAAPAASALAAGGTSPSPGAARATPLPASAAVTGPAATVMATTPAASATATSATAVPAVSRFSVSILDMNQPCIPVGGQRTCDPERLALWNGDATAWRARFQAEGRPAPSPDEIFVATMTFRIEAGEPAFTAAHARALGWPHVRINAARYRGREANELDEWVEVKNHGGGAQEMSGWSVRLSGTSVVWSFAEGFVLEPGQACKFYVGPPGADPCPGSRDIAPRGVLPDDQGTLELWVDFLDLRADRVSYHADPANQPPPPNLQGFS